MVGDEGEIESLPTSGVLTSPNFPSRYPNNHDSTQTIQVAEGKTIRITFTSFSTDVGYDFVHIFNEDGTNLGTNIWSPNLDGRGNLSGHRIPRVRDSNSNIVHVRFQTDSSGADTGWSLDWEEL